jgi:hypothetical protein
MKSCDEDLAIGVFEAIGIFSQISLEIFPGPPIRTTKKLKRQSARWE